MLIEVDKFGLLPLPHPPTPESTYAVVDRIIESVPKEWKLSNSSPNYSTEVYYKVMDSEPWFLRKTLHDADTHPFEWFKRAIYDDHFDNMVKYYEVVQSNELKVEREGGWKGYTLKYKLPAPFAERDLATWLLKDYSDEDNTFTVVALPADIPLPEDATTRGVYSFFHRVRKTEDNQVEWIMGQTSDMKGNLPRWVQNYSIGGILVSDVKDFVNWLDANYGVVGEDGEESDENFEDAE
ncbi:hypothetical protein V1512DRAFT_271408 [Lipomyces arxii]|uniref:uncharacterized protein n=1 Tax=Lipomyces arxii TaxID=56418 RepID=UPI0034CE63F5